MSAAQSIGTLAGCAPPPERRLSLLRQILSPPANEFEAIPRIAYEKPVWEWKSIFGHNFVISEPAGDRKSVV